MKVKKLVLLILLPFVSLISMVGCAQKTEYDDLEITKIKTSRVEGFSPFLCHFSRTFDFEEGKVYDTIEADPDFISDMLERDPDLEVDEFNNPKQVATFTHEQATA